MELFLSPIPQSCQSTPAESRVESVDVRHTGREISVHYRRVYDRHMVQTVCHPRVIYEPKDGELVLGLTKPQVSSTLFYLNFKKCQDITICRMKVSSKESSDLIAYLYLKTK